MNQHTQHLYPIAMSSYVPGMPYLNTQHQIGQQAHKHIEPPNVHLIISQQPKEALVTTDGKEKVRKPIDPPPIVQLKISEDADPNQHFLQSPYLFMTSSLVVNDESGTVVKHGAGKSALSGSLTSSLHRLKDPENRDGAYFVFGDVSCKEIGTHRLKFSLFDLHKETMEVHFLASITSEPFKVVLAKDFRGLDESTYLSRAFSDQGVRLRLRKEPRTYDHSCRPTVVYHERPSNLDRQHAGTKRSYSNYNGMSSSPGDGHQEAGYEFGNEASPHSDTKRQRGASSTHQQHGYSYSHQPVRTPESNTFPQQSQSFMQGNYPSNFTFSRPSMATPSSSFAGTTGPSNSTAFDPSLVGYDYTSNQPRGVLESPHRPHGLTNFTPGSMQQGLREEEAAGSLQSLAVQASHTHTSGALSHPLYMQDNVHPVFNGELVDPAIMESARPISRYQENVQHHLDGVRKSELKHEDKPEAIMPLAGDDYYSNGY